jgi:hypothetical protein
VDRGGALLVAAAAATWRRAESRHAFIFSIDFVVGTVVHDVYFFFPYRFRWVYFCLLIYLTFLFSGRYGFWMSGAKDTVLTRGEPSRATSDDDNTNFFRCTS